MSREKDLAIAILIERVEKLSGKQVTLEEDHECHCGGSCCTEKEGLNESKIITAQDYDPIAMLAVLNQISDMADAGDMSEARAAQVYSKDISDVKYLRQLETFARNSGFNQIAAGLQLATKGFKESVLKETFVESPKQVWKVIGTDGKGATESFDVLTYKDSLKRMLPELQKEFPAGWTIKLEWVSTPRIYKDSNLFKKESVLKEGTWALGSLADLLVMKNELIKFKDKIYKIAGDDELFDGLDSAATRLDELIKYRKANKA